MQKTFFVDGVAMQGDLEMNLRRFQQGDDKENAPTHNQATIPSATMPLASTPREGSPPLALAVPRPNIVMAYPVPNASSFDMDAVRGAIQEANKRTTAELRAAIIGQHEQSRHHVTAQHYQSRDHVTAQHEQSRRHVTAQHEMTRDHTTNGVIALLEQGATNTKNLTDQIKDQAMATFLGQANRQPPATSTNDTSIDSGLNGLKSTAPESAAPEAVEPHLVTSTNVTSTDAESIDPDSTGLQSTAPESTVPEAQPTSAPKRVKEWAAGVYTPAVNAARARRAERIRRRAVIASGAHADWMPSGWTPPLAAA